jgi:FkbM family methyltransferase
VDPGLQIEVFEPSKTTFKNLSQNVQLNNWDITMNHMALGNKEGVITMNQPDAHNSGMNFMSEAEGKETDVVPLSTWDIHFSGSMSSDKRVLVKIDAEGAEHQILEGGVKYISEVKPVIFIELLNSTLNRFGSDTSKVYDLMVPLGYAFFRLNENEKLQECAYGEEGEVLILIHKDKISLATEITG